MKLNPRDTLNWLLVPVLLLLTFSLGSAAANEGAESKTVSDVMKRKSALRHLESVHFLVW